MTTDTTGHADSDDFDDKTLDNLGLRSDVKSWSQNNVWDRLRRSAEISARGILAGYDLGYYVEDIVNESINEAQARLPSHPDMKRFGELTALTKRIAENKSKSYIRKEHATKRGGGKVDSLDEIKEHQLEQLLDNANNPLNTFNVVVRHEKSQIVRKALETLKPQSRRVLHDFYFLGMKQKEISAKYHIPIGTVSVSIQRALKEAKTYLVGNPGYLEHADVITRSVRRKSTEDVDLPMYSLEPHEVTKTHWILRFSFIIAIALSGYFWFYSEHQLLAAGFLLIAAVISIVAIVAGDLQSSRNVDIQIAEHGGDPEGLGLVFAMDILSHDSVIKSILPHASFKSLESIDALDEWQNEWKTSWRKPSMKILLQPSVSTADLLSDEPPSELGVVKVMGRRRKNCFEKDFTVSGEGGWLAALTHARDYISEHTEYS